MKASLGVTQGLHLNGATIMTTPSDQHIRIARDSGYSGVEVRAERLLAPDAGDELRATSRLIGDGEVWSLNGLQLKVEPDGTLRRDVLTLELELRLTVCEAVSAAYLLVVPPRAAGVTPAMAMAAMVDGLSIVRDAASRVGVGVAFEFLGFGDCPIDSPALAADVAAAVPGIDLVLDSCHWHASGSQSLAGFPIERLAMVHLNDAPSKPPREIEDADRLLPTLGVIRLGELISLLRGSGFSGPWSLETFNPEYWSADPRDVAHRGRALTERVIAAR